MLNIFHLYSFEPYPQKVHLDEMAGNLEWPPRAPPTEPEETTTSSMLDLRVLCGDSHSTFTFSLYRYPPGYAPQTSPQGSRGAYTAVSFHSDREVGMSSSGQGPQDRTKVNYTEINVPQNV